MFCIRSIPDIRVFTAKMQFSHRTEPDARTTRKNGYIYNHEAVMVEEKRTNNNNNETTDVRGLKYRLLLLFKSHYDFHVNSKTYATDTT